MVEICQTSLPIRPWEDPRLRRMPGLVPTAEGEWLLQDDAYGAQMAYREQLMRERPEIVHQICDTARPAADELLDTVLDDLSHSDGFKVMSDSVRCPDGRVVRIDRNAPLMTCGALVQEDLIIMQKRGDEHVLTGAILCFPASWSLQQKFLKPMIRIHKPVASYTPDMARRVQRLFDGVREGRPMWRANCLTYDDPDLHQPRNEGETRPIDRSGPLWVRVERQGMRRLPVTDSVVFSVHTYVVARETVQAGSDAPLPL